MPVVPRPSVGMCGCGGDALGGKVFKPGMEPLWMPICTCLVCRLSVLGLLHDRLLLADGGGPAAFESTTAFGRVLRFLWSVSSPPSSLSRSSSASAWLTASVASELLTASELSVGSDPSDLSDSSDPSVIEQNKLEVEYKSAVGSTYCGCG